MPGDQQLITTAVDLARDSTGRCTVLADHTQAPSGAGYALENRVVVSRVFPSLYRDSQVHRLAPFFRMLRSSLEEVAPPDADDPRIVLLSPGPWSETAFEHAYLASYLGYPLVEGTDLTVRDGRVWLRSLGRLERVDVILRRTDAWFCDPLELRPDSKLGVPGLVEAARLGGVSIVNTLGSGVLENPGLAPYLPRLAEHLLGEQLLLPSVPTWWCGDDDGLPPRARALRRPGDQADRAWARADVGVPVGAEPATHATICAAGSRRTRRVGSVRKRSSSRRRRRSRRTGSKRAARSCARSPSPATTRTPRCPAG